MHKNKKFHPIIYMIVPVVALVLIMAAACSNPLEPPWEESHGEETYAVFKVPQTAAARSMTTGELRGELAWITAYHITITHKENGNIEYQATNPVSAFPVTIKGLKQGLTTFRIEALDTGNSVLAMGEKSVSLQQGKNSVEVSL
ncbi:MAG: hypothetical protein LBE14_00710, partial [Treponema sp.]|nr:hypothetical protein [Treponema sp.]